MRYLCFNCPYNKGLELGNGCGNDTCIQENMLFEKDEEPVEISGWRAVMEEKERYKVYKDNRGNAYICDTIKNIDYKIYQEFVDLLNQQANRIKELEEELDYAKRDYIPKLEFGLQRANKMGRDAEKEIQQLKQRLADKEKYTYTGKEVGKIEQNYDNQLAITEKALELACEHIKEDLKCDDTQDEIYNYFKNKAKEMLEK